jgi:hypothetical protein
MTGSGRSHRSKMGALLAATLLATLVVGLPAATRAAEDPRELQGRKLYAKGEYQAALDLFATLFAEKGDPVYLRNVGRCNQKLKRPDQAIDAFRDYLRRGHNIKVTERTEIEGYIKEMEALKALTEREREREREREKEAAAQARAQSDQARERELGDRDREQLAREREQLARERAAAAARDQETKPAAPSPVIAEPAPVITGAPPAARPRQTGTFFLAMLAGTGTGIASGKAELNERHSIAASGFSPAQFGHIAPEIGVFLLPRLLLSAQLRLQYVAGVQSEYLTDVCGTGEHFCRPSRLGLAGFGRIAWLAGDGIVHFVPGLAVGGGNIRHAQEYADDFGCGEKRDTSCVDTVASGPFLFGPSVGLLVELGDTVGLMASLNTQLGVPKFTINFDFNAGVTFRL